MVITPSPKKIGRSEAFHQRCLELPAASIALRHREGVAVESLHGQLQEDQGHAMDAMGTDWNLSMAMQEEAIYWRYLMIEHEVNQENLWRIQQQYHIVSS